MKARDVMVAPVITASPSASVREVARSLVENRISGLPVVDEAGELLGIVSEGDLLRRAEVGMERPRSWWLRAFEGNDQLAADYVKSHARKASDVMTKDVVTAAPDAPLDEIAALLEKHGIKRLPIVERGKLVGIVTRANLVQAIATAPMAPDVALPDADIRRKLLRELRSRSWAHADMLNVTVKDGVVHIWGLVGSEREKQAIRVATEATPGVRAVKDQLTLRPQAYGL